MNGAHALLHTLVGSGVTVCFANPGTSEMHFVAAVDDVPEMRTILGLFEGVATGAADGYARMTDRPAATLLHLGPGMANGIANLHNARRANVPLVNIVGDHATYHKQYDAPLEFDIDAAASTFSGWVDRPVRAEDVGKSAAAAVAAACGPPAVVATLILPADVSWNEGAVPGPQRLVLTIWPLLMQPRCSTPARGACCCWVVGLFAARRWATLVASRTRPAQAC